MNEKYELMEKNIIKEELPNNYKNNNITLKPFYLMTLEDGNGETKQIKIYKNSDPYELAYNFCKENNLDFESMKYIKRNIKNIIKKFEEKEFYFINNSISEEDEDNCELGDEYQNVNNNNDNELQNKTMNNNKIINSLIKNKGKNNQLKINKIPPKQTTINEQIKKVVKNNSVLSPTSKKTNLKNMKNNNFGENLKYKNEILTYNNLYKTINNLNINDINKLNEININTDYRSTTERNREMDNMSKNNIQNSFENGVPELINQNKDSIKNNKKNKSKPKEEVLNKKKIYKINKTNESFGKNSKSDEEIKYKRTPDKYKDRDIDKDKDKEKLILKNSNEFKKNSKLINRNKNNNNHLININKITNINNNNFNCNTNNKNNININNNIFSNKICFTSSNKNSLNIRKTLTDVNNMNYKLINLRKNKNKSNHRKSNDITNINSYRNNDINQHDTMLFLTECKNIINILNDLKKNLKCKNRNLSNENDKTANNSYLTKIIKKLVNQYRCNRSYEKLEKNRKSMQNKLLKMKREKLMKRKNLMNCHFSPQQKLNRFIEFNHSKKNSKSKDIYINIFDNNKSHKNINNYESSQLEKEIFCSDIINLNLSDTSRNINKKVKENKSFNESRFFKKNKNKIKSKILNKNINNKLYNQKYKNNKSNLKKKNYTISNTQKIFEDKFTHYGSCNFKSLSKDFINGYLEGLKSKFTALIYSPLKEEKNLNNNLIFSNQKNNNYMINEQKYHKKNMTQKCLSNLKDLSDNKIKNNIKKELIINNNNNNNNCHKRNFKINNSSLNTFNKSINFKSIHNSKEKIKNSSLINDYSNKPKTKTYSYEILIDMLTKLFFYLTHDIKKDLSLSKNYYLEKLKIFPKEINKILNKMVIYLFNNTTGKNIDKKNFIFEMSNIYNKMLSKNEKNIIYNNRNEIIQIVKQKKFQNSGRYKSIYQFGTGLFSPLSLNNIKTTINKDKKKTKGIFNTICIANDN